MPTRPRLLDPRSIITPDAFELSPDLLGMPLAPPGKRLVAILIDLAVIGLITAVTKSVPLLLGVVAAALFIREGTKRTPVRGSVFNRAMRFSVGCLGLIIAGITIAIASSVLVRRHTASSAPADVQARLRADGVDTNVGIGDVLAGIGAYKDLHNARTDSAAERAMKALVRRARDAGMESSDVRDLVMGLVPKNASWSDGADSMLERAMAVAPGTADGPAPDSNASDSLGVLFQNPRVADSLHHLRQRVADLEAVNHTTEQALTAVREENQKKSGGFFNWLKDAINELGFGFGWGTMYMTVLVSWWKGQTVGKRIMGIRILRLDGLPMTWWSSFDRAGGYAAGLATGLLGFAQVFWDANRQAIHDRISGTVVVLDGAPKVGNWEEAL